MSQEKDLEEAPPPKKWLDSKLLERRVYVGGHKRLNSVGEASSSKKKNVVSEVCNPSSVGNERSKIGMGNITVTFPEGLNI